MMGTAISGRDQSSRFASPDQDPKNKQNYCSHSLDVWNRWMLEGSVLEHFKLVYCRKPLAVLDVSIKILAVVDEDGELLEVKPLILQMTNSLRCVHEMEHDHEHRHRNAQRHPHRQPYPHRRPFLERINLQQPRYIAGI
ncbi:hypothetical protein C4D60_Mb02t12800 [Musa balbisiana]|uniref:Uncharacterized protein n=1 Tax=Musa balbisiana TaxID=52838 RepID=A0A4S8IA87_MUSBA|nr:hypothetical protein C4D60_Mb02t12800 [Musa balbisiana]